MTKFFAEGPKVTSIVLTWNSAGFIEECLASLLASHYRTDVLVVDNDSADNTRELIAEKFPEVKIVNSGANLGYAGGNNIGVTLAQEAGADYIFILNPDATISPDTIGLLLERMEHEPRLAVASPIIYTPGTKEIWYAGSKINWHTGTTSHEGCNQIDSGQFKDIQYTERANGCAMLLRTSAIDKVGLMDENYFLYYEEVDWSVRFTQAGYGIGLVPEAHVWHKASSSTGGHASPIYQYYMARNRLYFMHKFRHTHFDFTLASSLLPTFQQLAILLLQNGPTDFSRSVRVYASAYGDYRRGRFGKRA